jgi:hypothetical protein
VEGICGGGHGITDLKFAEWIQEKIQRQAMSYIISYDLGNSLKYKRTENV